MNKLLRPLLIVAALALGACQTTNPFATVTNPVTSVDIWRVKNVYAATLDLSVKWRTYCYSKPYSAIIADPIMKPACKDRRKVVRQIQKYQPVAGLAVQKADDFVKKNPTVNAAGAIGLAWDAVTDFQKVVPTVNN